LALGGTRTPDARPRCRATTSSTRNDSTHNPPHPHPLASSGSTTSQRPPSPTNPLTPHSLTTRGLEKLVRVLPPAIANPARCGPGYLKSCAHWPRALQILRAPAPPAVDLARICPGYFRSCALRPRESRCLNKPAGPAWPARAWRPGTLTPRCRKTSSGSPRCPCSRPRP